MSGAKDSVIKLFGTTIQFPEIQAPSEDSMGAVTNSSSGAVGVNVDNDSNHVSTINSSTDDCNTSTNGGYPEIDKDFRGKTTDSKMEDGGSTMSLEEIMNPGLHSSIENSSALSYEETPASKCSKTREAQKEKNDSQEETPKKPNKILPCPRCNSMETKFCYYNNYNVNQPRYFCKKCQRYWTAGGTMRDMPVGAGRRKNKTSTSHNHQLTVSEAFQYPQTHILNGFRHPSLEPDAMFLAFGNHTPLSEPKTSDLNHRDKSMKNSKMNGFHKPEEQRIPLSCSNGENDSYQLSKPSKSKDDTNITLSQEGLQSFLPHIPFSTDKIWPFPWNLSQWSPTVTPPTFCPPGFAIPLYPVPAYWGCTVSGTWNAPLLSQQPTPEDADSSSPTLGKHSREENKPKSNNSQELDEHITEKTKETNLWVPKTLRLDDPRDAAKSSIWTTLGIKNDMADSVRGSQLFKRFAAKDDEKIHFRGASPVLQANPAALSRSLNFHESAA